MKNSTSENKAIRVAIYVRVSTLDQAREGYSLAAQERVLREWCATNGYVIVDIYADEGISGKDIEHRPDMRRLLEDAQLGNFDLVLIWALSRLTRSVADLYDTWELLSACDVDIQSYTEPFDTSTPIGRAMMGLLGVFAQMERELTAERVRAAIEERATQGKRTYNEVLGYDLDGKDTFKINELEAERIRYIFSKYIEYRNLSAVAELCRLKGYTGKRGRIQTAESIRVILDCPIYAGYNRHGGMLYRGNHPKIVSVEMFNTAQRYLHKKNTDKANILKS